MSPGTSESSIAPNVPGAPAGAKRRARALRLQERDLRLLADLSEAGGLLDSAMIHRRFFPDDQSGRSCRRRLKLFEGHGLIEPVFLSVARTDRPGRPRTIYRLLPAAEEILRDLTGYEPIRSARAEPPSPHKIEHRIGVGEVVLVMNDACALQRLPKPQWILEYDPLPAATPRTPMSERFALCHDIVQADGKSLRYWPDAACLLRIPAGTKTWSLAVVIEYDRSTEGHQQVGRKMPGLKAFVDAAAQKRHWPDAEAVRAFFIVQTTERLQNVAKTLDGQPGADSVRLAIVRDLVPDRLLTAPIWRTTDGEAKSILAGRGTSRR